jgi:hypothetical protein
MATSSLEQPVIFQLAFTDSYHPFKIIHIMKLNRSHYLVAEFEAPQEIDHKQHDLWTFPLSERPQLKPLKVALPYERDVPRP